MARAANQKLKILYILKLLEHSDEAHVVTMRDILGELAAHGIQAERKRIYDDLEALRKFGYPIAARRGRMAGYYLETSGGESFPEGGEETPSAAGTHETVSESRPKVGVSGSPSEGDSLGDRPEADVSGSRSEGNALARRPDWLSLGDTKAEISCEDETARRILGELGGNLIKVKAGKRRGNALLKLKVRPGGDFYGWLAGFGCQVRLEGPPAVIKEYRRFLKDIRNLYKEG